MVSTLERLFNRELATNSKDVYNVTKDAHVKVLVRPNSDRNKFDNKTTILYPVDTDIDQGNEIVYNGVHYLTMNKDNYESEVFCSSDLIAMNADARIYDEDNDIVYFFNVHANDVSSVTTSDQTYATLLRAAVSVMAPDNEVTRKIKIDDYIQLWGYKYTIIHAVRKNGICSIYAQYYSNASDVSSATCPSNLDKMASYIAGDSIEVIAEPRIYTDNGIYNVKCDECKFTYQSSDESVAKFDGNILTFVGAGTVKITTSFKCDYSNETGSSSITITVIDPYAYTIEYQVIGDELYLDYRYNKVTANLLRGGVAAELPDGATVEWSYEHSGDGNADYITCTPEGLVLTVSISNSLKFINDTITFVCKVYDADGSLLVTGMPVTYEIVNT